MKQGFKRTLTSFFQKRKDKTTSNQIKQDRKVVRHKKRLEKQPSAWKMRKIRRKFRYDGQDMKHISGQARIAARWIRKAEYKQRKKLRPALFPIPVVKG